MGRCVLGVTEITHWQKGYADDTSYSACTRLEVGSVSQVSTFLLTFKIISALEHFVFKISFWGHSHLQCSDCLPTHIKVYLLSFAKVKLGH